jgi:hypothetical protein
MLHLGQSLDRQAGCPEPEVVPAVIPIQLLENNNPVDQPDFAAVDVVDPVIKVLGLKRSIPRISDDFVFDRLPRVLPANIERTGCGRGELEATAYSQPLKRVAFPWRREDRLCAILDRGFGRRH